MKIYSFIIIFLLLSIEIQIVAQETPDKTKKKESPFFWGGNVGLAVGDVTIIEVSPHAGYYFTPRISAGLGLKYHYYKENRNTYAGISTGGYSSNIYGARVFSSYEIIRDLGAYRKEFRRTGFFLHAEYEVLNMKDRMIEANESPNHRVISQNEFAGIGLRQWIKEYKSVYILMLYNFNYDENTSPYDSEFVVRIGINL